MTLVIERCCLQIWCIFFTKFSDNCAMHDFYK